MNFRNFLIKFSENFRKFSQECLANNIFRPNAKKLNAGFVKFFEKYSKKSIFSNFLKKCFENFLKILEIVKKFFENFYKIFTKFLEYFLKFLKKCPPPEKILATPMLSIMRQSSLIRVGHKRKELNSVKENSIEYSDTRSEQHTWLHKLVEECGG